jgi:uroporphyrinogen-III synthase
MAAYAWSTSGATSFRSRLERIPSTGPSTTDTTMPESFVSTSKRDNNIENNVIGIALTREIGQNKKLRTLLEKKLTEWQSSDDSFVPPLIQMYEMPCICHAITPDADRLSTVLQQPWTWIAVTSPEAARVLAKHWKNNEIVSTPVCAVGKATAETLQRLGISVAFTPSTANAETLVKELPLYPKLEIGTAENKAKPTVLYPASKQAASTLVDGLTERNFDVTRINSYDTIPYIWNHHSSLEVFDANSGTTEFAENIPNVRIACFGSPSAVRGWCANTIREDTPELQDANQDVVLAACIGSTSAAECRRMGWPENFIFYPPNPGLVGWVDAIYRAIEYYQSLTHTQPE